MVLYDKHDESFNQLSFDGGGTRGAMEVYMLDDVMKLVTVLTKRTAELSTLAFWTDLSFKKNATRKATRKLLDETVEELVHPTEVFDMIVGTSTGALIAFALIGGKRDARTGKRKPMSVKEVLAMYEHAAPIIFKPVGGFGGFLNKMSPLIIKPYSQDGVEKLLKEYFGEKTTLKDFNNIECIAGAVARQHNASTEAPDHMELFDTRSEVSYNLVSVLKASTDAPIIFRTPTKIGDRNYVDGGVGGNCPVAQSIPRMKKLRGPRSSAHSVLSFAPPFPQKTKIPRKQQWKYWIKYFPEQFTDGNAIYLDTKNNNPEVIFQRLAPRSAEARQAKTDATEITSMMTAMRNESLTDPAYFRDVFQAALVIACRAGPPETSLTLRALTGMVVEQCLEGQEFDDGLNVARAVLKRWQTLDGIDLGLRKTLQLDAHDKLGRCYGVMGEFEKAAVHFDETLKIAEGDQSMALQIAKTYNNIGHNAFRIGDFKRALEFYEKSLKLKIELLGENPLNQMMASTYANIANCCAKLNRFEEAASYQHKSLAICKAMYGDIPNAHTAIAYSNIARSHSSAANYKKAIVFHNKSLEMKESLYGKDGLNTGLAISHENLGVNKMFLGEYKAAMEHFKTSLKIEKALQGADADLPLIAELYHDMGVCHELQGNFQVALINYEKSLKMLKVCYKGAKHEDVARETLHVGECLRKMGKMEEAWTQLEEGGKLIEQIVKDGEAHRYVAEWDCYRGNWWLDKKDTVKARSFHEDCLEMRRELYGRRKDHTEIAQSLFHLGRVAAAEGKTKAAKAKYEESLEMYKRIFGEAKNAGMMEVVEEQKKLKAKKKK